VAGSSITLLLLQFGLAGADDTVSKHPAHANLPVAVTVRDVEVQTPDPGRLTFVPELELHNLSRSEMVLWLARGDAQLNERTFGLTTVSSVRVALPAGATTSVRVLHIDLTANDVAGQGASKKQYQLLGDVMINWPAANKGASVLFSFTGELTREQARWLAAGARSAIPGTPWIPYGSSESPRRTGSPE
jgi:hypothetical protein